MMILKSGAWSLEGARAAVALRVKGVPFVEEAPEEAGAGRGRWAWVRARWSARQRGMGSSWMEAEPVLVDGSQRATGFEEIVRLLDERGGAQRLVPAQAHLRGRARLVEQWAHKTLRPVVRGVLWGLPANAAKARARLGRSDGRWAQAVRTGTSVFAPRATQILTRLAAEMAPLDEALAETGWIGGEGPTVADVSVAGYLSLLEEMDGWETVRARRRVAKLVKTLALSTEKTAAREVEQVNDEAREEASRHRASSA